MSIISQIQAKYDSFTGIQRRISDYILRNSSALIFMTLENLAAEIGSSTTSIIRFARVLGFSGYSEFIQTLRKEMLEKDTVPQRLQKNKLKHAQSALLQSHIENTMRNVYATAACMASSNCGHKAAQMLSGARRIFVFGTCSMESVAKYLVSTLHMIHENVVQLSGVGGIYADEFLSLGEGDVFVTFLFPRYEFLLLKLLPVLRSRNVRIIVFTSAAYDSIQEKADLFIPCQLTGLSVRDSLTPVMFAIDYISAETAAITDYSLQEQLAEKMETMVTKFYMGID